MADITSLCDLFPQTPPETPTNLADLFFQHVTTWLTEDYPKLQKERSPGLHASSLWKTCARKRVLEMVFASQLQPEKLQAGNFLTFDLGHALHHWWQNNYLGPMGVLTGNWYCQRCDRVVHTGSQPAACPACSADRDVLVYAEYSVRDDEMGYVGHCDGVLQLGPHKVVFEFKTASPTEYDKLTQPKMQHVVQAHAYMYGLKINDALIVYQNKASQCEWSKSNGTWTAGRPKVLVFHVKFDPTYWANYKSRCADYHKADRLVRELPTVTPDVARSFERLCAHTRSAMAEDCPVSQQCFQL